MFASDPRFRRCLAPALTVLSVPLTACGGSAPASISRMSAAELHRDVQSIRAAALGGDATGAEAALATLRGDVTRLSAGGELARADAAVLLLDASQINARIAASAKPRPATTTTTSTTPAPAPAPPGQATGHGKGHGHGNGNGGDGGND